MEDRQIVELYWQKNADAISETSSKYGACCFTIADHILNNAEDSEECVNDTWLPAWNVMPSQRHNVLRMFLAKITRNLSINRFNARGAEKRGGGEIILVLDELADCLAGGTDAEAAYEVKELEECIRRFVQGPPERDGKVFVRRYFWLFDPWRQKPSANPVKTVQSAIEGQAGKEYTIAVRIDEIKTDGEETARVRASYTGSELAEAWGWTSEYLEDHFVVVWAKYYVEYDHTKTFLDDGPTEQYFYLTQDVKTGEWTITDNDSPRTRTEP
jgi:RNA polymerase sigma-70 factor (ECF subfamily)